MSFNAVPESIEDKVLSSLSYTHSYDIDNISEFTVRRYTEALDQVRESNILTVRQYAALIRCYFKIDIYRNKIVSLIEEAYDYYPQNIVIHKEATMCFQSAKEHGMSLLRQFDLRDYWFNRDKNPRMVDFVAVKGSNKFEFFGEKIATKKRLLAEVVLRYPDMVNIEAGPFSITRDYDEMKRNNFDILLVTVNEYIDNLRTSGVCEDKTEFLMEYFNEESMTVFKDIGNRELSEAEAREIEAAKEDIEDGNYEVFDSVEDLIATL